MHLFTFVALLLFVIIQTSEGSCPKRSHARSVYRQRRKTHIFYIDAIHGNDAWAGKYPRPRRGDGPFKTFANAFSKIRLLRRKNKAVTLYVRKGTYFIAQKISLGKADSNIAVIGYPKDRQERPLLSGALKISGRNFFAYRWRNGRHRAYAASFSGKCSSHAFLGGKRLIRARKPNLERWTGADLTGSGPYLRMRDLLEPTPRCNIAGAGGYSQFHCPEKNKRGFKFYRGDINPRWRGLRDAEILVFNSWTAERRRISYVNETDNSVYFRRNLRFPVGKHPGPSGFRFVVENVLAELDTVGEFYCDNKRKIFYVIPPVGALDTEDVYMAQTTEFFKVQGAEKMIFQDLAFKHSHDRHFSGYKYTPAMFDFRYSKHISFIRCKFANIGYTAIHASMVYNFNVQHCTFKDVGNMPLTVGYNGNIQHKYATRRVNIKRNTFVGCGVYTMYQPSCIHVKGIARISVHDNDVSMSSYAGIRAGWQNTFAPDYNNKRSVFSIKRNHVHHYGNGILNDFAGIYMSSNMLDCGIKQNMSVCHLHARVEENAIHHSRAFYYGAIGVYSDTAASSIKVTKNWIYKLSDCAVNFHCGQNNAAVNNMIYHTSAKRVFGLCNRSVGPHGRMPKQTMEFSKNVIYLNVTGAHLYGRGDKWNNDAPTVRRNNYYFKGFSQQQFDRFFSKTYRTWRDWNRVARMDRGSIIANPRFVNVNRDDYRLSKRSPARKMIWSVDLRNVVKRSGACFG